MATKVRKYKKVSCHTTITAAKKAAVTLRNQGKTASIRKQKKGACVFSAGAAKVSGVAGRKRRRRTKK